LPVAIEKYRDPGLSWSEVETDAKPIDFEFAMYFALHFAEFESINIKCICH